MIGKEISHYRILEKLGEGGMGVVYKAEDTKLDRLVALKFLPHYLSAEEEKKRFIHEAKAASALDHLNICTIYEIDETEDGQMFIAIACYEGETLKQKIVGAKHSEEEFDKKSGTISGNASPLQIGDVIDIAIQIAQGLAKAHEHGIVHRDIKPANVIITKDGIVKILDFGLAKLTGATKLTKSSTTMGTAAYMSPEQARGEEVDHRTDIWSVGVILYEMLTGGSPFRGDYDAAITYAIIHEEPEPIDSIRVDAPTELNRIINKAMQKDRTARYQQVRDLLRDLTAIKNQLSKRDQTTKSARHKSRHFLYIGAVSALLISFAAYFFFRSQSVSEDRKSIAVLPFKNLSDDKEDEYFSDGITEDIIAQLSKIGDLKVISRTSAMRYKNTDKSLLTIGKELGVATVLEGSVRRAGNRVRIVSQLIDARGDEHLWSETYDRDMKDIFAIQSEVAENIATALRSNLFTAAKSLSRKATENLDAYNLYLKGRYFLNKGNEVDLKRALQFFEQAIELDPAYAAAYSGLADAYLALDDSDFIPEAEAAPKAKAAGRKALEIDETVAEAHTSLGHLALHQWDWPTTEAELKRAITLNPGYAPAHHFLSMYLATFGYMDEAIAAAKRAEELDPLSMLVSSTVGIQLYRVRRYDEAIAQLRKTIDLDPNYPRTHRILGKVYFEKGLHQKAIAEFEKYSTLTNERSVGLAYVGNAYGRLGKRDEARRILDELIALSQHEYVSAYAIAIVYIGLGDKDQAFEWLNKACEERSDFLVHLKVDPDFDSLRSDPRFAELMKKVGVEK